MSNSFDSYFESHFKKINDLTDAGFERSAKYYASFYKEFLPDDKNSKILDAGCGVGQFLYFLKREGYCDFYGVDLSSQQIEFCRNKVTTRAEVADAFQFLASKTNFFDVIVINDVLEHILKDKTVEFLNTAKNSLKKNGLVFIKVPNMGNPFGLMDRYMDITHEVGFTEFSLAQLLEMVGFKNIIIKGASYPVISLKTGIGKIAEKFFYGILKILFLIQGHAIPRFLDKDIIAIARI